MQKIFKLKICLFSNYQTHKVCVIKKIFMSSPTLYKGKIAVRVLDIKCLAFINLVYIP